MPWKTPSLEVLRVLSEVAESLDNGLQQENMLTISLTEKCIEIIFVKQVTESNEIQDYLHGQQSRDNNVNFSFFAADTVKCSTQR